MIQVSCVGFFAKGQSARAVDERRNICKVHEANLLETVCGIPAHSSFRRVLFSSSCRYSSKFSDGTGASET